MFSFHRPFLVPWDHLKDGNNEITRDECRECVREILREVPVWLLLLMVLFWWTHVDYIQERLDEIVSVSECVTYLLRMK